MWLRDERYLSELLIAGDEDYSSSVAVQEE